MQNGGLKRIRETTKQYFDETGLTERIKKRADELLRSGETKTFDELEKEIMAEIIAADGHADTTNIGISDEVKRGGAAAVKKEMGAIVELKK
jgi:hypothetical protein